MGFHWVVQQYDQWETVKIVCHQSVFMRPILENVGSNLLPRSTQYIMWDKRILLLAGFCQLAYVASFDVLFDAPVVPGQYMHSHTLSRVYFSSKWPICKSLNNSCFWDGKITSMWALKINPSYATSSSL